ncbi:MAG: type II toxin-antitoxin system VapC family toxin [Deltaproteobacteria bacterium]
MKRVVIDCKLLRELPISIDNETSDHAMREILSIGREQGLSSYDAAYLELAMRHGLALATRDTALRKAAKKSGVKLI